MILEAFAQGIGGKVSEDYELQEGYSAFYGVVGIEPLWRRARSRDFYYLDNSFFDSARRTHFRVGVNRLQSWGDCTQRDRFNSLGIKVKPWRKGRHVVVVMQSEHFMNEVACWPLGSVGWQEYILNHLKLTTDRPIVVRHWSRDKTERARTLKADLQDAHMLVTHASAAANEALLEGVPVMVTDPECPAHLFASSYVESPRYEDGREEWAARLCNSMWTLEELRNGERLVRGSGSGWR